MLSVSIYDLFSGQCVILREGNVAMDALILFGLLSYISMLEACVMIDYNGYLFAYNVDKALCVQIKDGNIKLAVAVGRRLYGRIFDRNCEAQFSGKPRSPLLRKVFYVIAIVMFFVALVSPCYYLVNFFRTGVWNSNLIVAWFFIIFDALIIVNRLFFRASIRRFWAYTLGDAHFRGVLQFELFGATHKRKCQFIADSIEGNPSSNRIPIPSKRTPSRKSVILTGVIMIILVIWVLNLRRNNLVCCSPWMSNTSIEDELQER